MKKFLKANGIFIVGVGLSITVFVVCVVLGGKLGAIVGAICAVAGIIASCAIIMPSNSKNRR